MGSRGLSSIGKNNKRPKDWKLNSSNAKSYGITLDYKPSKKFSRDMLDTIKGNLTPALDTINELAAMLGLHTDFFPEVLMHYGVYDVSANGNCRISQGKYDAEINLFDGCLLENSLDTAAHEMVHALEAMWVKRDFTSVVDQRNAWIEHVYSENIVRNALIAEKLQSSKASDIDFATWHKAAGTIYRTTAEKNSAYTYAQSAYCETVTTAVQMVMRHGNNASSFAKAVVQELKNEYQRQYRKYRKSKSTK